jgi:hypothetical protein
MKAFGHCDEELEWIDHIGGRANNNNNIRLHYCSILVYKAPDFGECTRYVGNGKRLA